MKKHYRGVSNKVRDAVWERSDGMCEGHFIRKRENGVVTAVRIGDCGKAAEQLCHADPKGIGGSKLKDGPENLLALCVYHHDLLDLRTFEKDEK